MPPVEPPAPENAGPPAVSRFEYNLLRLLRFTLGAMPAEQAHSLIYARVVPAPRCLTGTCVRLAEDTLAKGVLHHLLRAGGWRNERFLRVAGGRAEPVAGRVWERAALDVHALRFSGHPLAFLMWLTAEKPTDTKEVWDAPPEELTPADELFFALALQAFRPLLDVIPALVRKQAFRLNPFCWAMNPGDFGENPDPNPPPLGPLVTGTRAVVLECLQPELAERWTQRERAKGQQADWLRMRQQGHAEMAFLGGYLAECERAGRPDLARFVLKAAGAVLGSQSDLTPSYWTGGLQTNTPPRLADRLEWQRQALAVPQQLAALQKWDQAARRVGYFDDGYAASQVWKADWEAARGDDLTARAKKLLNQLDPLKL